MIKRAPWGLARVCVGALLSISACTADPGYGGQSSSDWIRMLSSNDSQTRARAARALGNVLALRPESPRVVDALVLALGDTADDVRIAAGVALATDRVRAAAATPALAALLADSAHPSVRRIGAGLLGRVRSGQRVAASLLSLALHDPEPSVRESAARGLGALGPHAKEAAPELAHLLSESMPALRARAVESLATIDPPIDLAMRVFTAAARDSDTVVRVAGALALGSMHSKTDVALAELVRLLADSDPQVRRAALLGVAAIGRSAERAEPYLLRLRLNDTSTMVREAAGVALAAVRGQARTLPLPEPYVRPCAAGSRQPNC